MEKKYILGIVIALVVIGVSVYFLFFRKTNDNDTKNVNKKSNLITSLKATGIGYEEKGEVEKYKTEDERLCNGFYNIIFGKGNSGGLDVIYQDITGKKMDMIRFDCAGKTMSQLKPELKKMDPYINEIYLAILKNKDIKKRNSDIVSLYILMFYGFVAQMFPKDKFNFVVRRDISRNEDIVSSIEITMKAGAVKTNPNVPPVDVPFSPSLLIKTVDDTVNDISSGKIQMPSDDIFQVIKTLASPLVNPSEISILRLDNNPKMTVDNMAACMIYSMSKIGDLPIH